MSETKSPVVGVAVLAKLFNLTAMRVQQLASDGVVVKKGRGQYELWPSVQNYIRTLQRKQIPTKDKESESPLDLNRTRLTKAKAEIAEIELSKLKGETLDASAVQHVVGGMVMKAKTKLEAFAHKLSGQLDGIDTLAQRHAAISEAVNEVLNELHFDTKLVVEEYVFAHSRAMEAETETDGEPVGG